MFSINNSLSPSPTSCLILREREKKEEWRKRRREGKREEEPEVRDIVLLAILCLIKEGVKRGEGGGGVLSSGE